MENLENIGPSRGGGKGGVWSANLTARRRVVFFSSVFLDLIQLLLVLLYSLHERVIFSTAGALVVVTV